MLPNPIVLRSSIMFKQTSILRNSGVIFLHKKCNMMNKVMFVYVLCEIYKKLRSCCLDIWTYHCASNDKLTAVSNWCQVLLLKATNSTEATSICFFIKCNRPHKHKPFVSSEKNDLKIIVKL